MTYDTLYGGYDSERSGNYLLDHWRGRMTLGQSYWINGGLIGMVVGIMGPVLAGLLISANASSLRYASAIIILAWVMGICIWLWGAVGIWRSAARHQGRGGDPIWAAIARAMVLVGGVNLAFTLPTTGAFMAENARLAVGDDSLGQPVSVRVAGDDLYLTGAFALGSADRFRQVLAHAPQARNLFLTSPGGRVGEAEQIGAMIKAHGLNTIANGPCLSACTIAFIAGKERSLLAMGRLGFHQPRFPGMEKPEQIEAMSQIQRRAYEQQGVEESFIDQSLETPPERIWLPDEPALFDAGFLNTVTRARVIEDNRQTVQTVGMTLPKRIDATVTMVSVVAVETHLTYTFRLAVDGARVDREKAHKMLLTQRQSHLCGQPMVRRMIAAGASYSFDFTDRGGRPITMVTVAHCPAP